MIRVMMEKKREDMSRAMMALQEAQQELEAKASMVNPTRQDKIQCAALVKHIEELSNAYDIKSFEFDTLTAGAIAEEGGDEEKTVVEESSVAKQAKKPLIHVPVTV